MPKRVPDIADAALRGAGPIPHGGTLQDVLTSAERVCESLREVLSYVALDGASGLTRVKDVVYRLGIDKSLASRVLRSVRAASSSSAFPLLPASEGVGLVCDAAVRAGCDPLVATRATDASRDLDDVVASFPGGRAGVRAALADAGGRHRASVEREARRAMVQALASLTGMRVECRYSMLAFGPGAAPGEIDLASLTVLRGLRRVRAGRSTVLMTLTGDVNIDTPPRRVAVDGAPFDDDPLSCIVPEFTSDAVHALSVERSGARYRLVLGPGEPPLAESLDFAMRFRTRGFVDPRNDYGPYSCVSMTLLRAMELMVIDVLFAPGVLEGVTPRAVFKLDTSSAPDPASGPAPDGRETVDLCERYEPMGVGFDRRGSERADRFNGIASETLTRAGWNPARFRRFRLEMAYPMPLISVDTWLAMRDGASASGER